MGHGKEAFIFELCSVRYRVHFMVYGTKIFSSFYLKFWWQKSNPKGPPPVVQIFKTWILFRKFKQKESTIVRCLIFLVVLLRVRHFFYHLSPSSVLLQSGLWAFTYKTFLVQFFDDCFSQTFRTNSLFPLFANFHSIVCLASSVFERFRKYDNYISAFADQLTLPGDNTDSVRGIGGASSTLELSPLIPKAKDSVITLDYVSFWAEDEIPA